MDHFVTSSSSLYTFKHNVAKSAFECIVSYITNNRTSIVAPSSMLTCALVPEDMDEPYTVMSPTGAH